MSGHDTPMGRSALIVVDVQHDFLPGGALGVKHGGEILPVIRHLAPQHDIVVASRDWHPSDHCSFGHPPEFRDGSWPTHCVQGTTGAMIHPAVLSIPDLTIVSKGMNRDREAYSAFQGEHRPSGENLAGVLAASDVTDVTVVGLALDYCVRATALDAVGVYNTTVHTHGTRAVDESKVSAVLTELVEKGVALDDVRGPWWAFPPDSYRLGDTYASPLKHKEVDGASSS